MICLFANYTKCSTAYHKKIEIHQCNICESLALDKTFPLTSARDIDSDTENWLYVQRSV